MKIKPGNVLFSFLLAAGPVFSCLGFAGEGELKKISLIPLWKSQAQFAGYYVALEKGFYKKHGLDVTILEGGPDYEPAQLLGEGKADFALMWLSSAMQRRSQGMRLINIAQVNQRTALMLVAKKASGILTPQDISGKKVNIWEGDRGLQPKAFFKKYHLDVTIVPQGYTVNLFLTGGVDVVSAMWYNEYHTIINAGVNEDELTRFFFSDYGLNFPEDGIYTLEQTYRKDPQASGAFVKASMEGWRYAFEHPDEALDIVLKYMKQANVPANRIHQKWMLAKMRDSIIPGGNAAVLGVLNKEDYARLGEELSGSGLIKDIPDFNEFYIPAKE